MLFFWLLGAKLDLTGDLRLVVRGRNISKVGTEGLLWIHLAVFTHIVVGCVIFVDLHIHVLIEHECRARILTVTCR